MNKPSLPKGTRDFLPAETMRRNEIFATIKGVFERYGYVPIETPAVENLSTLTGKYGEEGDRLIFKILNSGDFAANVTDELWQERNSSHLVPALSEKALRYDLTVPFARYVVQHQNELTFPFKRYQIQPVWRADRPQKGRYREFFQCDIDAIGSNSLLNEVEMIQVIDEVFTALRIAVAIKFNHRGVLYSLAEQTGNADRLTEMVTVLDKLDKIQLEGVQEELRKREFDADFISGISQVVAATDGILDAKDWPLLGKVESYDWAAEVRFIKDTAAALGLQNELQFDPLLARGLDYYTGAIFEVVTPGFPSSICGGGRYDNLTGIFGLSDMSGVGVSFGADRIYDVMKERDLFKGNNSSFTQLLFVNFGEKEALLGLRICKKLREKGVRAEVYPDAVKLKKQMKYANDKGVQWVVLMGEEEMKTGELSVKNMADGSQKTYTENQLIELFA